MNPRSRPQPDTKVLIAPRYEVINPLYLIMAMVVLAAVSSVAQAQTNAEQAQHTDFYHQLVKSKKGQYRPVYNDLLSQVTDEQTLFMNTPPDLISDQDLAFNYLWMQRYQSEKHYKEGGAAAGKLVRMGVKALYKMYTGQINYNDKLSDDDIRAPLSSMDYRLRLSSSKVKIGVKYEF